MKTHVWGFLFFVLLIICELHAVPVRSHTGRRADDHPKSKNGAEPMSEDEDTDAGAKEKENAHSDSSNKNGKGEKHKKDDSATESPSKSTDSDDSAAGLSETEDKDDDSAKKSHKARQLGNNHVFINPAPTSNSIAGSLANLGLPYGGYLSPAVLNGMYSNPGNHFLGPYNPMLFNPRLAALAQLGGRPPINSPFFGPLSLAHRPAAAVLKRGGKGRAHLLVPVPHVVPYHHHRILTDKKSRQKGDAGLIAKVGVSSADDHEIKDTHEAISGTVEDADIIDKSKKEKKDSKKKSGGKKKSSSKKKSGSKKKGESKKKSDNEGKKKPEVEDKTEEELETEEDQKAKKARLFSGLGNALNYNPYYLPSSLLQSSLLRPLYQDLNPLYGLSSLPYLSPYSGLENGLNEGVLPLYTADILGEDGLEQPFGSLQSFADSSLGFRLRPVNRFKKILGFHKFHRHHKKHVDDFDQGSESPSRSSESFSLGPGTIVTVSDDDGGPSHGSFISQTSSSSLPGQIHITKGGQTLMSPYGGMTVLSSDSLPGGIIVASGDAASEWARDKINDNIKQMQEMFQNNPATQMMNNMMNQMSHMNPWSMFG